MERKALNRKPDLSVRKSFMLDNETEISEIGITVRQQQQIANNKSLTEEQIGLHAIAAKILVNGQPIVYDDLLDCFTSEELAKITDFILPDENGKSEKNG